MLTRKWLLFAEFAMLLFFIWFNSVAQAENPFDKMKEIAISKGQEKGFVRMWATVYGSKEYWIKYDEPSGGVVFQENRGEESIMISRVESGSRDGYTYSFARLKGGKIFDVYDITEESAIKATNTSLQFLHDQRLLIPDGPWTFYLAGKTTPLLFCFYHKQGIIGPSPGIIRVWTKNVFASDFNLSRARGELHDAVLKNLSESKGDFFVALWEIQCSGKMGRGVITYECDKNGKWGQIIHGGEWERLVPGANLEALSKAACP